MVKGHQPWFDHALRRVVSEAGAVHNGEVGLKTKQKNLDDTPPPPPVQSP